MCGRFLFSYPSPFFCLFLVVMCERRARKNVSVPLISVPVRFLCWCADGSLVASWSWGGMSSHVSRCALELCPQAGSGWLFRLRERDSWALWLHARVDGVARFDDLYALVSHGWSLMTVTMVNEGYHLTVGWPVPQQRAGAVHSSGTCRAVEKGLRARRQCAEKNRDFSLGMSS